MLIEATSFLTHAQIGLIKDGKSRVAEKKPIVRENLDKRHQVWFDFPLID